MIEVIRSELSQFEARLRGKIRDMQLVPITVAPEVSICPKCFKEMKVQKTYPRFLITKKYGNVRVRLIILECKYGCKNSDGSPVTRRSEIISRIVPKGANIGYDVEVHVGVQRYIHYRQREEIQEELQKDYDIEISTGKISDLTRSFLKHFKLLHESRSDDLRKALEQDGGYPLNIDATGENGAGTLFVAIAGWRKWVLGAWRLTTECAQQISPCLEEIKENFGVPLSITRDYGRALIPSVQDFVDSVEEDVRILGCHQHFCGIVGKDLLKHSYDELTSLLRKHGFKTPLGSIVREWGKRPGVQRSDAREDIEKWSKEALAHKIPVGPEGIAILRSNVQWALDTSAETKNLRFPFALPQLIFYDRCKTLRRACDVYLKCPPDDAYVTRSLKRLAKILDPIITDKNFCNVTKILRTRKCLFDELRAAIRINPKMSGVKISTPVSQEKQISELNDIEQTLEDFRVSLSIRRSKRGIVQDMREAIDAILKHLDRHGESLWGHVVHLPEEVGGGIRLIERTNIDAEGFFNVYKQGERRRSGRKVLSKDLESTPPESALVKNIKDTSYMQILCGSIEKLPETFAKLDKEKVSKSNRNSLDKQKDMIETASLSRSDKIFIRNFFLGEKILGAAASCPRKIVPIQI
jgi:hypothetical protein